MDFLTLAQTASADPQISGMWVLKLVAGIFSGLGVLGGALYAAFKKGQSTQPVAITNQPLLVQLEERFVTREDFREYKDESRSFNLKLEGLFQATMTKVEERDRAQLLRMEERDKAMGERMEERDEKLHEKIELVASKAYEARGKIHQKVNLHGESIAVMNAKSDIADQIGKLAGAITEAIAVIPAARTSKRNIPS